MCVDYTNLNKHCPKDPFGLPQIDQVIDSMAGCDLLYFLDCYSGYPRSVSRKKTRRRPCSSPRELSKPVLRDSSTRTSKPTWMTWLSRPEIPKCSSPILKRLSHPCESTARSSTRTSASLAYRRENYSASSSSIASSKPIPRRSPPSPT
jgi:hypothetical protein